MKHYGDITKIHGDAVEIVDIITGGSPCQDLSVAGRRAGLDGERSGLFMEQIRIVKEMREHDVRTNGRAGQFIRPRYMVWENVPGAFSSNGGKDFQAVLTEIARIAEPKCPDVPMPEKNKWRKAGCIYDDLGRWSIAWRLHDAQFWGVPQRRKRIALVADFGGLSAAEILFERKGLSRDSEQGEEEEQGTASASEESIGKAERSVTDEVAGTLDASYYKWCGERQGVERTVVFGICSYDSNAMKSPNPHSGVYAAETARTLDENGGSPDCNQGGMAVLMDAYQHHGYRESDTCGTLTAGLNQGVRGDTPLVYENHSQDSRFNPLGECCETVSAKYGTGGNNTPIVLEGNGQRDSHKGDGYSESETMYTLNTVEQHAVCIGNGQVDQLGMHDNVGARNCMHDQQAVYVPDVGHALKGKSNCQYREDSETHICENVGSVVRRLTPTECERLQGYPDGWTDIGEWTDTCGKRHKDADSPRYKALGNSIALPFWAWLARRICAQYERPMTMASLFDGISGFPLVFARAGCKPVWTSEIEEFAIAVCKKHFGDKNKEGDLWKYLFQ